MINLLLKNPLTIWLRWLLRTIYLKLRFFKQHVKIGYLAGIFHCKFGMYNTIYDNAFLLDSELGDFSYVNSRSTIIRTKIGKFSAISHNVICGPGMHPSSTFVSSHPIFYSTQKQTQITFADTNYFKESNPIVIGNDVWIGANVIVLEGVSIGDGAIIGAGSVVTKDVSPYAIVGGVPAKLIRYRFNDRQIAFLLSIQWWNKDINWLRQHYKKFHDINNFMNTWAQ